MMELTFKDYAGRYLEYERGMQNSWYKPYTRAIQFIGSGGYLHSYILSSHYFHHIFNELLAVYYKEASVKENWGSITCNMVINIPTCEECREVESTGIISLGASALWNEAWVEWEGEF